MKEETIGSQRLICGDALEVIDGLDCVDAILLDPPYGIQGSVDENSKAAYDGYFHDTREYLIETVVPIVKSCIAISQRGAMTPGYNNMFIYPEPAAVGCFWTPAGGGFSKWGWANFHPIYYYGKDPKVWHGSGANGKQVTERAEKNGHPCPKPIEAWTWLLKKVSAEGETVFDAFSGSFTTAVACEMTGRKGICVEINPTYFEIGLKRVEQAVKDREYIERGLLPPIPIKDEMNGEPKLFGDM